MDEQNILYRVQSKAAGFSNEAALDRVEANTVGDPARVLQCREFTTHGRQPLRVVRLLTGDEGAAIVEGTLGVWIRCML